MLTLNSTLRNVLEHIPSYQPIAIDEFYKKGWWVAFPQDQVAQYIHNLGLEGVDLRGKSFMDAGCAEGYACFYAEEQGASYVIGCDGHAWKFGTHDEDPWGKEHPQNEMILFEITRLLRRSRVVRLVEDVESPAFVDSVHRLGQQRIDVILCAGLMYHTLDPVKAMRNLYSVAGEMVIFNIPDLREWQADSRVFTPYANRPGPNDFNYSQVLPYGATNQRIWTLSPEDWQAMMQHVGFVDIETETSGKRHVYRCYVPLSAPARRDPDVQGLVGRKDAEIARLRNQVTAYEQGRFMRTMRGLHNLRRKVTR